MQLDPYLAYLYVYIITNWF